MQLYACETFTTVLAPGYNVYHYDHIHVDLMRRESGSRPCRPNAIPGEVVAARVRAQYAAQHRGPDLHRLDRQRRPPGRWRFPARMVRWWMPMPNSRPISVPKYLGRANAVAEDRLTAH